MAKPHVPSHKDLLRPVFLAVKSLGGSGTIEELNDKVAAISKLSDEQLEYPHDPAAPDGRTEFEYRLAWARTYLKKAGYLENSTRGVWALTKLGANAADIDPIAVVKEVTSQRERTEKKGGDALEDEHDWRDDLALILADISAAAFERLIQRLLRESGFSQVEVTGRSGDGGIDGKGLLRVGGFLGFHVLFQCKKWKGSVGAGVVRDFRGAMVGRADKGLLITTGSFTKDAVREATRDGAPAIDLIDGEQLAAKLKEFGLGIATKIVPVEVVTVDPAWFKSL